MDHKSDDGLFFGPGPQSLVGILTSGTISGAQERWCVHTWHPVWCDTHLVSSWCGLMFGVHTPGLLLVWPPVWCDTHLVSSWCSLLFGVTHTWSPPGVASCLVGHTSGLLLVWPPVWCDTHLVSYWCGLLFGVTHTWSPPGVASCLV